MAITTTSHFRWLPTGDEVLAEMIAAIEKARHSIRLEMYIFQDCPLAERFRQTLLAALGRGVKVQVLVDSLGSVSLPDSYWDEFREKGGAFRWFNPFQLRRMTFRNHRKSLTCDDKLAIIGGVNIAPEYQGDGVHSGWCDLGLRVSGSCAEELAEAFDHMFAGAELKLKLFARLRKSHRQKTVRLPEGKLLLSGPGRNNPLKTTLAHDLKKARRVQIICAYFLPPRAMRRALMHTARAGGKVQLILPGKSDVPMSQLAARSLYRRLMRAGVEIYEYQPQILHAKLFLIDEAVMVGSANLDPRSLSINYELLLRLTEPALAASGKELFERCLTHCRRIEPVAWRKERTLWTKIKSKLAYFLLARLDTWIARYQWRGLKRSE